MNRIHNAVIQAACGLRAMGARVLAGLVGFVVPGIALADRAWNFQPPVTPIAKDIFELCRHLHRRFRCDVLLDLRTPEIEGPRRRTVS